MRLSIRLGRPFDEIASLQPELLATYMQALEDEAEEARQAERG